MSATNVSAPESVRFCTTLAQAVRLNLPGRWSGSAYRHHPCGVVRRGLLFVNQWSMFNYCEVHAFTVHPVKFQTWCNDPRVHGDPIPHPVEGKALTVYLNGEWRGEDGPWRLDVLAVLDELDGEIKIALEAEASKAAADRAAREAEIAADWNALRTAQIGGAS